MSPRNAAVLMIAVLLMGPSPLRAGSEKQHVPDADAQQNAAALVGNLFKAEFDAAKTSEQKSALAQTMLRVAVDSQDDPPGRYVLVRIARDVAVEAGDAETVFQAITHLERGYEVDGLAMRTAVLPALVKSLRLPKDHQAFAATAQEIFDEAVAQDRFDLAKSINATALESARAARTSNLVKHVVAEGRTLEELEAEYASIPDALETLQTAPSDPAANLVVGQYQCFTKGEWERGIPMLALGADERLKSLAIRELADPPNAHALGDAWWDYSESTEGNTRAAASLRAALWYYHALPALSGLAKVEATKRLDTLPRPMLQVDSVGMELVAIPPGEFTMGSPPSENDRNDDEDQVSVTLTSGFWLGKTEVTQDQWRRVMGTEPWKGQPLVKEHDDCAATYVSWEDATEFCRKLTDQERRAGRLPSGWEYTLPSEAQWEYACRGGTTTRFHFGDDESRLSDYAWFDKNAWDVDEKYAHQVGRKRANAWGLHDMHGNVWEWCRDGYQASLPGGADPEVAIRASFRVLRGGSWGGVGTNCRSGCRDGLVPGFRSSALGFRVARSSSP